MEKQTKTTKIQKSMLKGKMKSNKAITLIALIVTIIVLLILAGVSIATLTGDNGLLSKAQEAKEATEEAGKKDLADINQLLMYIEGELGEQYDTEGQVNKPLLLTGMTAIKFNNPTADAKGSVNTDVSEGWYDYEAKEWANAQTEDGSLWVWIPRFAYKITYYTDAAKENESTTKTQYGSIDVKFLVGTTDQYYDETTGKLETAVRAKTANDDIDATKNYVVHPAFTDESSSELNYANGGWDKELTGIWVSKFEAGYASGNNSAPVKASSAKYTQTTVWANREETGTGTEDTLPARNWLDGVYGKQEGNSYTWLNGEVSIKYPTFQGKTYAMNYININDAFNITKVLNESGNIYGLSTDSDSHLMKNSEWGAVVYLGQSQYGLNGTNVYVNNANLNNSTESVYAVTGMCSAESADKTAVTTTIENINSIEGNTPQNNLYTWDQLNGQKASSTGTIYGVYDMSGGTWERTAGYVANGNGNLKSYGRSLAYEGETLKTASTKYTTVYPNSSNDKSGTTSTMDELSQENYEANTKVYGDGIRETSIQGTSNKGWNSDYSVFPALGSPFAVHGGHCNNGSGAGLFAFYRTAGGSDCYYGFRAVLCAQ